MASFESIRFLFFTILLISLSTALYEDQVGKFDWKRSLIGKVKHAKFDSKHLFVATHDNVIASLNLKNDQIAWRQLLESPLEDEPQLLHLERDLISISGSRSNFHVRGWDPLTGVALWEWTAVSEQSIDPYWLINGEFLIRLVSVQDSYLEVTTYHLKTGALYGNVRKFGGAWGKNCVTTKPYFVCITNTKVLWVNVIHERTKSHNSQTLQTLIENYSDNLQLIEFNSPKPSVLISEGRNSATILEINDNGISAKFNVSPGAICIGNIIYQLEANLNNLQKLIRVKSLDLNSGKELSNVSVDYPLGLGGPYIVSGSCTGTQCHLLWSSTDDAAILVRFPEGKVIWVREEALSNVVAVEFLELPASELEVNLENEFTENSNIFKMLLHRITMQSGQLYNLFTGGQHLSNNALIRDDFGLHKIIVVATASGKLFGVDTLTGSIVWSYRLPNVKAFKDKKMLLFVQRTARYVFSSAQCILLAEDEFSGLGVLFRFDPITGASVQGVERLTYRIKQALLLSQEDGNHLKQVLIVGEDNSVYVYPGNVIENGGDNVYIYSIEEESLMRGYKLSTDLKLAEVWQINLGSARLLGASTRPSNERVHSQGRVLPDRSVYYKYVNPNLIALATINDDPVHKHVVSVYLIDGVTGFILYSTSHKRCKGPVLLVHSENWLVYTFFNERFRRNEVVSAELYEGHIQSNSTALSSFGVSQLPHIQTQSYILPATPVSMTVTLTERGITNKFLLVALTTGGVVEIPWLLLQPRFADIPCGSEESCIPYMPEIPLPLKP